MKKSVLILMLAAAMVMVMTTGMAFAADEDISSGYDFKYDEKFTGDLPDDNFFDGGFYVTEDTPFTPAPVVINTKTQEVVPADAYTMTYARIKDGQASFAEPPFTVSALDPEMYFTVVVEAKSGSGYTGSFQTFMGVTAKHWMGHYEPLSLLGEGVKPVYNDDPHTLERYDVPAGTAATPDISFYGHVQDPKNYSVSWYSGKNSEDIVPANKLDYFPYKEGDYLFVVTGNSPYHGQIYQRMHIVGNADNPPVYPSGESDPETKENTIKASGKKPAVKYAKLKKKTQTIKASSAFSVKNAVGKVTYKVKTYDKKAKKKITVSSSGKVTVKKGLKKGKYTLKVKVTAKGGLGEDGITYKAKTVTTTLTVRVK